jgi:peptidoglycan-associated lipoprotein
MKKYYMIGFLSLMACFTSCTHSSTVAWEDTKSFGRYMGRKGKQIWGKETESKQVSSKEEFTGPVQEEFIPLKNEDLKDQTADLTALQPQEDAGALGGAIPSIEHFKNPGERLSTIFRRLHFETDDYVLRSKEDYACINKIATYLKEHANAYIFVEGHTDERASEAYNQSLGLRRSNTVRNLLIKRGIDPNRVYTISYGKEMPVDPGHTHTAWTKNRRVQFKIYEKR